MVKEWGKQFHVCSESVKDSCESRLLETLTSEKNASDHEELHEQEQN